jgi:prepilin-type N-terminal cleavage/methylation domain-containing protein
MRCTRTNRDAFTLVELLVVIGIIAVLISVLLPSLSKARQAANLVDCQSRLRQMGQAMQIYVSTSKGLLPWGGVDHSEPWTDDTLPNNSNRETFWWWFFTLSEIMDRNTLGNDGLVHNLSPVFSDRDTVDHPGGQRFHNHYTCNPRVMYRADVADDAPAIFGTGPSIEPQYLQQRKITSIRRPSSVFVIWDAPQAANWTPAANSAYAYHAYGIAEAIDGWGWNTVSALCYDTPNSAFRVDRPIAPGTFRTSQAAQARLLQKRYNFDARDAFLPNGWLSHFRFRHMNNSRLAALCLDGHVETRAAGEVMVRDVFTNYR